MAFSVSVHKQLNLVFTEYSGFIDTAQLLQALSETLEHPDYKQGMVELTDLSGVTKTDLDFRQMLSHRARMAAHYDRQSERTEHFAIAPTDLDTA